MYSRIATRWRFSSRCSPITTAAAIDRLVHHSVILELNVTSYRMEAAKQRTQKETK